MLAGWRELAVILEGLWLAIRAEWGAIRIFLSSERLQQLLFARLELVPDLGVATLLLPVFVEDGQKADWKGAGWGLGGSETRRDYAGTKFLKSTPESLGNLWNIKFDSSCRMQNRFFTNYAKAV